MFPKDLRPHAGQTLRRRICANHCYRTRDLNVERAHAQSVRLTVWASPAYTVIDESRSSEHEIDKDVFVVQLTYFNGRLTELFA